MITPTLMAGWSLGALSMIVFDMAWDAYGNYKKALRESKCPICEGEE
tara:strand:+ start:275 stop:415 length:141 start_codon:yes stop_codon:yes gene_type:complete